MLSSNENKSWFGTKLAIIWCFSGACAIFAGWPQKTNATPINFGETICASIDSAGEVDTYTFSASAGDSVLIRMSASSGSLYPEIRLYGPDGNELAWAWDSRTAEVLWILPGDGQYTILAADHYGNYTGSYCIFVQRVNNPGNATAIGFGQTISGSIDSAAKTDTYTFSAGAGDSVLIRMSKSSGSLYPEIRLYGPDGNELAWAWDSRTAEVLWILPSDGQYTVLTCDHYGNYTGSYCIFVQRLNNPGNATPIGFGQTISGSIDSAAKTDTYTFSAGAGDSVLIRMSKSSGSLYPEIRLYGPDGNELAWAWDITTAEVLWILPGDGQYTILAADHYGNYTGSYYVFVQRLNNPGNATPIVFGQTISGSIDTAAKTDTYAFSAVAGDSVLIRMSASPGFLDPEIRLYGPDGNELAWAWDYYSTAEVSWILPGDGQYTILARDSGGDNTGGYGIFVQRLNNPGLATPIGFGQTISGSIDSTAKTDSYTFSAGAGDSVLIRMSVSLGYLDPEIRLYGPDGNELAWAWDSSTAEVSWILPGDGQYTVLACDSILHGTDTGGYGIFVQRVNNPGNATAIGFGQTISGSIDSVGEVDTYTFPASAGDSVLIRMSVSSVYLDPEIRLYGPDGNELAWAWGSSTAEVSWILPGDGQYTILACDSILHGTDTGGYTLSLSQRTFEHLTLGIPYSGVISEGEWHLFYVDVNETGKNLLVSVEPNLPTGFLELYGRYGQALTQSDCDCLKKKKNIYGNYELLISPTASGTYYLGVYGRDIYEGNLNYKITASIVDRHISDIYPLTLTSSVGATVHILGLGFTGGMQVELRNATAATIPAGTVAFSSAGLIIANFDLSTAPLGMYDISIIWPDSSQVSIPDVIEVKQLQEGALYSFELDVQPGSAWTYPIVVPNGLDNLFVTLQKSTLVNYGDSWRGELSLLYNGNEIASASGSHDLILHIADPNPGSYTVEVTASHTGSGILTVWASLPELPFGEWVVGKIYCSYGSTWYQVDVPPEQDKLCFEAEAMGLWSHFNVYYDVYGSSNHWVSRQGTNIAMEIPAPDAGTYIVEFMDSAMLYTDSEWSDDQTRDVLIRASTTFTAEPLPFYLPTITTLSTNRGGNAGLVTVEIKGAWLDPNATVSLVRQDYNDIVAQTVLGDPNATTLTATFDLTGKEPGDYNFVVTNPDRHMVIAPPPFNIEQGGEPKLWVEVVGPEKVRIGRDQRYIIRCGNAGSIDAYDAILTISLSPAVDYKIELPHRVPNWVPLETNSQGDSYIPIWFLKIGSAGELTIPIIVQFSSITPIVGQEFHIQARLSKVKTSEYSTSGDMAKINTSPTFAAIVESVETILSQQASNISLNELSIQSQQDIENELNNFLQRTGRDYGWFIIRPPIEGMAIGAVIGAVASPFLGVDPWTGAGVGAGIGGIIQTGIGLFMLKMQELIGAIDLISGVTSSFVNSTTPEDKYGPTGCDLSGTPPEDRERFVPSDQEFYYKVDFWNKEDATAPACDVDVNDQLDSDLDFNSFRFENVGFRKWNVNLEPCQYFNVNVDMRPDVNLIVNVEGTFNAQTGEVTWVFRSLDPYTLQTPDDPMAGFLPPITESGEEVGWVGFSVEPKAGLPTGTQIKNQAFVKFDVGPFNPAPKEGPWLNTLDVQEPNSYVLRLPSTTTEPNFLVEWTGDDDNGSGIRFYDIYVSTDGNDYVLWLDDTNNTSAVFTGAIGHTYAFYSIALDNVGNTEAVPTQADATTMVVPTSQISVKKCLVKAGKTDNSDMILILGLMGATADDFNDANYIQVTIDSNDIVNPLIQTFPIDEKSFKKGKYNYARTESASKTSFKFDTKTGKFSFMAKNIDLSGLGCPLTIEIKIGDYTGAAEVNEATVNGPKKPIPIKLMMGVKNSLRVDKIQAKHGNKPDSDQLSVKGGFAVEDPNVNLVEEELVVTLAEQTFTLPAGSFKAVKGKFTCSKANVTEDGIASATFNFTTCSFTITIKNITIEDVPGAANFSVEFADFSESVPVVLP